MRVSRWGNSLAVRIPKDVVEALGLKEGSRIALRPIDRETLGIAREPNTQEILESIRQMAKPLPKDWKFDREEANAR